MRRLRGMWDKLLVDNPLVEPSLLNRILVCVLAVVIALSVDEDMGHNRYGTRNKICLA